MSTVMHTKSMSSLIVTRLLAIRVMSFYPISSCRTPKALILLTTDIILKLRTKG